MTNIIKNKLLLLIIMLAFALSLCGVVSASNPSDQSCTGYADKQYSGISSCNDPYCQSTDLSCKDSNAQSCDQLKDTQCNSNEPYCKQSNEQSCDHLKDTQCYSNEPYGKQSNEQSCDQNKKEYCNYPKENNVADLSINKTVDNPNPNYLTNVTWTVNVINNGPNTATNVVVKDIFPSGLQFVSATPSVGTFDPSTGIWSIGTLDSGISASLMILTTVTGHNTAITDIVKVTAEQCDKNLCNNIACATINVPAAADIGVTKTVNNTNPFVGDTIRFLINVTNNGPDNATGVSLSDILNPAFQFVSADSSLGTFNSTTGIWTIGDLEYGLSTTLNLVVNVLSAGTFLNTATVSADPYDPFLANNTASVTVIATAPAAAGGEEAAGGGPTGNAAGGEFAAAGEPTNVETALAAGNAIPVQETGLPIALLLMAVMMVLGGFISKRK